MDLTDEEEEQRNLPGQLGTSGLVHQIKEVFILTIVQQSAFFKPLFLL